MEPRRAKTSGSCPYGSFFFFNDTATTEIYTLSLHDALPISSTRSFGRRPARRPPPSWPRRDRKSTRLNSSHVAISYAVFCLKQKKHPRHHPPPTHPTHPRPRTS